MNIDYFSYHVHDTYNDNNWNMTLYSTLIFAWNFFFAAIADVPVVEVKFPWAISLSKHCKKYSDQEI